MFARGQELEVDPFRPAWSRLRAAAAAVGRGDVVAIPTDTVYGLAADPFQPAAVERIFELKRRPETRPILLLIDSEAQMRSLVEPPPASYRRLAAAFWPGPLTLILRAAARVPAGVTAGTGTVAVRLPAAPVPRAVARLAGPITGTSANRSGRRSARTAAEIRRQLGRETPLIINGGTSRSLRPSTIVDLSGEPRIVREGVIPAGRLEPYFR